MGVSRCPGWHRVKGGWQGTINVVDAVRLSRRKGARAAVALGLDLHRQLNRVKRLARAKVVQEHEAQTGWFRIEKDPTVKVMVRRLSGTENVCTVSLSANSLMPAQPQGTQRSIRQSYPSWNWHRGVPSTFWLLLTFSSLRVSICTQQAPVA